jgi:hypothetical protein
VFEQIAAEPLDLPVENVKVRGFPKLIDRVATRER